MSERPSPHVVPLSFRESDRVALRPMVAAVEQELNSLSTQTELAGYAQVSSQLEARWRRLLALMALGEPPEVRACPHCKHEILRHATRCIQCWKQSPAAGARAEAPPA